MASSDAPQVASATTHDLVDAVDGEVAGHKSNEVSDGEPNTVIARLNVEHIGQELRSSAEIDELIASNTSTRATGRLSPGVLQWDVEIEVPGMRKKMKVVFNSWLLPSGWWNALYLEGNFAYAATRPDSNRELEASIRTDESTHQVIIEYQQVWDHIRNPVGSFVTTNSPRTGVIKRQRGDGRVWDIDAFVSSDFVWDTMEVHPDESGHENTTQTLKIGTAIENADQKIVVGIRRINYGGNAGPRGVYGSIEMGANQDFDITLTDDYSGGPPLLGGALSWYLPPPSHGIFTGTWKSPNLASTNTRLYVPFLPQPHDHGRPRPGPFSKPPLVIVWLSGFLQDAVNDIIDIRASVDNVNNNGFYLVLYSNGGSSLRQTSGSWIAVDEAQNPNVRTGVISSTIVSPQQKTGGFQTVESGFGTVIIAFTSFSAVVTHSSLKINLEAEQTQSNGFTWVAESWDNGILRAFEASYICF